MCADVLFSIVLRCRNGIGKCQVIADKKKITHKSTSLKLMLALSMMLFL